jgi:hypothetical protein
MHEGFTVACRSQIVDKRRIFEVLQRYNEAAGIRCKWEEVECGGQSRNDESTAPLARFLSGEINGVGFSSSFGVSATFQKVPGYLRLFLSIPPSAEKSLCEPHFLKFVTHVVPECEWAAYIPAEALSVLLVARSIDTYLKSKRTGSIRSTFKNEEGIWATVNGDPYRDKIVEALYVFQVGGTWLPCNCLYYIGACRVFCPTNLESIKSLGRFLKYIRKSAASTRGQPERRTRYAYRPTRSGERYARIWCIRGD